jgi:hypothetical protein
MATRLQVVRHSFRVMWVWASQSSKQVLSQKATRPFISAIRSGDFSPDNGGDRANGDDGGKVMVFGGAAAWPKADSAARHRTRKQVATRMSDTRGMEEAGDQNYLPVERGQSVQIPMRMVYGWPRSKRRHRFRFAARRAVLLTCVSRGTHPSFR